MTVKEALKLVDVDYSSIVRDSSEESREYPVVGSYEGEGITVVDKGTSFFIGIFSRKKNFNIHKITGAVEEVPIFVA